jgi:aspartyl aminopeptidase
VLDGPFAMMMKKHWELVDFGKFMYEVKKEYHLHKAELEADLNEEQFMALYEQQEKMNELGDEFLDKYQEIVTPSIADYVRKNEEKFVR